MSNFLKGIEGVLKHPLNEAKYMLNQTKEIGKPLLKGDFQEAFDEFKGSFGDHQDMMQDTITVPLLGDNKVARNSDAIAGAIIGSIFAAPAISGAMGGTSGGAGGTAGQTAASTSTQTAASTAAPSSSASQYMRMAQQMIGKGQGKQQQGPTVDEIAREKLLMMQEEQQRERQQSQMSGRSINTNSAQDKFAQLAQQTLWRK